MVHAIVCKMMKNTFTGVYMEWGTLWFFFGNFEYFSGSKGKIYFSAQGAKEY